MNFLVHGTCNNFRFNFHEKIPYSNTFTISNISADGKTKRVMRSEHNLQTTFIELNFPKFVLTHKNEFGLLITSEADLKDPWINLNLGVFFLEREHVHSTWVKIIVDDSLNSPGAVITVNGELFDVTRNQVIVLKVFDFEFVKTYLEFDQNLFNCVEFEANTPVKNSYLVAVNKIGESTHLSNEQVESSYMPDSCYIVFRNERNELINLKKFLIFLNFKI